MFSSVDAFERASVEELAAGVVSHGPSGDRMCLVCGATFPEGGVFSVNGALWTAAAAARRHVEQEHGTLFPLLLELAKTASGITDLQGSLLEAFFAGQDDRAIAQALDITPSTVRNHRFRLKERGRQAKIFLALMRLLEDRQAEADRIVAYPSRVRMTDERFALGEDEYARLREKLFTAEGALRRFPLKSKERIAVLRHIAATAFVPGRRYTEQELREILGALFEDHALLRRCLVDFGFMRRTRDGASYWVEP